MKDFVAGVGCFFKGVRMIRSPGLKRYVILPISFNILVFSLMIYFSAGQFQNLLNWLLPDGGQIWMEFVRGLLWLIFAATVLLILFFTFTLIANLLASPFNGLLAEKVEQVLTGQDIGSNGGMGQLIREIPATLVNEGKKILYMLVLALLILPIAVIPILQLAFPVIWVLFSAWILGIEYISYPMENHGLKLKAVRKKAREKRMALFGFGLTLMGATLIPIVNFIVLPAGVIGATCLWVESYKHSGPLPGERSDQV